MENFSLVLECRELTCTITTEAECVVFVADTDKGCTVNLITFDQILQNVFSGHEPTGGILSDHKMLGEFTQTHLFFIHQFS